MCANAGCFSRRNAPARHSSVPGFELAFPPALPHCRVAEGFSFESKLNCLRPLNPNNPFHPLCSLLETLLLSVAYTAALLLLHTLSLACMLPSSAVSAGCGQGCVPIPSMRRMRCDGVSMHTAHSTTSQLHAPPESGALCTSIARTPYTRCCVPPLALFNSHYFICLLHVRESTTAVTAGSVLSCSPAPVLLIGWQSEAMAPDHDGIQPDSSQQPAGEASDQGQTPALKPQSQDSAAMDADEACQGNEEQTSVASGGPSFELQPPEDAVAVTADGGVLMQTLTLGDGSLPPLHARCLGRATHATCYDRCGLSSKLVSLIPRHDLVPNSIELASVQFTLWGAWPRTEMSSWTQHRKQIAESPKRS